MKILITGARGMLGTDLVQALDKHSLIVWDIQDADIRDESTVSKIVDLHPEVVIHLAACTNVDACESQQELAYAVNGTGTKHVALGAAKCDAKLIYTSTDYIFDGDKFTPYLEEDTPNPLNVYGRSKLKGEQYIQEISNNWIIIRTEWLYGKNGKNFIEAILRQVQAGKDLAVVTDQTGSPTYTVDLAKAITDVVEKDITGIFNITNCDFCTWYEFAQMILGLLNIDKPIKSISSALLNRPAKRPAFSVLNLRKARKEGIAQI